MLRQEELEEKRRQEDEERKRRADEARAEMMRANAYQMKLKVGQDEGQGEEGGMRKVFGGGGGGVQLRAGVLGCGVGT